jgi:hypothetical protein
VKERLLAVSEALARRTPRRGLFGRGAEVAFGALAGAAAGTISMRTGTAGIGTTCAFPGPPCRCEWCQANGVCAKPCVILTTFYATGCWVEDENLATCCDCDCPAQSGNGWCGCGSDYHNDVTYCPDGNASGGW